MATMTRQYKTNLRCAGCVAAIAPHFDGAPGVTAWRADVAAPDKVLTVEGEELPAGLAGELLGRAGYQALEEIPSPQRHRDTEKPAEEKTSYFPLLLIVLYLLAAVAVFEWATGAFEPMRAMRHFMAGFFLVFSFFKLLDLRGFADSYATYDLVAARSRGYALAYPFLELALGLAYLSGIWPTAVNAITLVLMLVGTVGVLRSLLARRQIRCACLGAVFNLPMSWVTLTEDVLMAAMAVAMLVGQHVGR